MTAACLTLLYEAACPIWPWDHFRSRGLLVEAYPAAQLCHWNLPHNRYNGDSSDALSRRRKIISSLCERNTRLDPRHKEKMKESADALDAVLCSVTAIAVTTNNWVEPNGNWPPDDVVISVYRGDSIDL